MNVRVLWTELGATARRSHYFLVLLLLSSVALNVLQARRIAYLKYVDYRLRSETRLRPGNTVPPLEGSTPDGKYISISFGASELPLVIYVFTPASFSCTRNLDSIKTLSRGINGKYRCFGVSLVTDGLAEYVEKNELGFPVLSRLSTQAASAYKFSEAPETLVVSSQGQVLKTWTGAYMYGVKAEVQNYFGVSLPVVRLVDEPNDSSHVR